MFAVLPLRVHAVDVAHETGQVTVRRVDQKVVLVWQKAVGTHPNVKNGTGLGESFQEQGVILFL